MQEDVTMFPLANSNSYAVLNIKIHTV